MCSIYMIIQMRRLLRGRVATRISMHSARLVGMETACTRCSRDLRVIAITAYLSMYILNDHQGDIKCGIRLYRRRKEVEVRQPRRWRVDSKWIFDGDIRYERRCKWIGEWIDRWRGVPYRRPCYSVYSRCVNKRDGPIHHQVLRFSFVTIYKSPRPTE